MFIITLLTSSFIQETFFALHNCKQSPGLRRSGVNVQDMLSLLLRRASAVEECDATGDDSSNTIGSIKKQHSLINAILYTIFCWFLFIQNAASQETFAPNPVPKKINAKKITSKIYIDGKLDEPDWKISDTASDFVQVEPKQGNDAGQQTKVYVLYDNKYLYIAAFCADSLGKKAIKAPNLKRDFELAAHDRFAVTIDGFNDKRNSMTFSVNPYGAQADWLSFDDILFDHDWNGFWKVQTQRTDSGWIAEMAIPWKTLRYNKSRSDSLTSWGINFLRLRRYSNELTAWSPYPRSFTFNRMNYAGELHNLKLPPPSSNIQINPYTLTECNSIDKKTKIKTGGDIKWAIKSNWVTDITFNTDFAQADADAQVNNLTRFTVFFPEKRQFFLENASFFGAGLNADNGYAGSMYILPFFSRRIGLDDNGTPIPIDAGLRSVYRTTKRTMGAMLIRQQSSNNNPLSHLAVARYTENINQNFRLGSIVTAKYADNSITHTTGIDGFYRINPVHSIVGMLLHSQNKNTGYAGYLQYLLISNKVRAWWTQSYVSKQFNPETGFVARQDVIATTPGCYSSWRPKNKLFTTVFRTYFVSLETEMYHQASTGLLLESSFRFYPVYFGLQNGGYIGISITPTYQRLTEPFEPLGQHINTGVYKYNRYTLYASSNPSSILSFTLFAETGKYFNGRLHTITSVIGFSPKPQIALKLNLYDNYFENVGSKEGKSRVRLFNVETRLALNPRLQLRAFYQRNTLKNNNGFNIRFSWEYKPLSYVYFVFNQNIFDVQDLNNPVLIKRQTNQQGIVKLSYLHQF